MPETTTSTGKRQTGTPISSRERKDSHKQVEAMQELGVVPEWQDVAELRQLKFDKLLDRRTRMYGEKKELEDALKLLDQDIMAALAAGGTEKVLWEERPVQIVHSKSGDRIVAEKLLLHGVPADVIRESTEPGKAYEYLLVGKAK